MKGRTLAGIAAIASLSFAAAAWWWLDSPTPADSSHDSREHEPKLTTEHAAHKEDASPPDSRPAAPTVARPPIERHQPFLKSSIHRRRLDQYELAAALDRWRERLADTGESHFRLWRVIDGCNRLLTQTQGTAASSGQPSVAAEKDPEAPTTSSLCSQIKPEDLASRYELLETAAREGDVLAQLTYPFNGAPAAENFETFQAGGEEAERFKANAVRFLNAAAATGSVDALSLLASANDAGVLVPKDPVASYAYTYAEHLTKLRRGSDALVALKEEELNPQQIAEGKRLASSIYKACCEN